MLTPTFSVTPLNPESSEFDSLKNEWKHLAHLNCSGVTFIGGAPWRLTDQHSQDKALLGYIPITSPPPSTMPLWHRYSSAYLCFKTNATTENQYLLIYHVNAPLYPPTATFYVNGNLVRSERVTGEEYISILTNCPPSQTWWYCYMFAAGPVTVLELKGIECYIL